MEEDYCCCDKIGISSRGNRDEDIAPTGQTLDLSSKFQSWQIGYLKIFSAAKESEARPDTPHSKFAGKEVYREWLGHKL